MTSFSKKATELNAIEIKELLPSFLKKVEQLQSNTPHLIAAAWYQIVGEKWVAMTKEAYFSQSVLHVKVKNSLTLSLLSQQEKPRLLKALREKFPSVVIQDIRFSLG